MSPNCLVKKDYGRIEWFYEPYCLMEKQKDLGCPPPLGNYASLSMKTQNKCNSPYLIFLLVGTIVDTFTQLNELDSSQDD
jgi:hypothetical protein